MKSRKRQTVNSVKQEFLWGLAIDDDTKLMLSTSDERNVDLRYWAWNGFKKKLYRTPRGVLIPIRCLPSLIDNLATAGDFIRNDQENKIIGNSTIIKKMTETAISLWTYTPIAVEGESRSVGIEVSEVDSKGVGLWPLGHFIIPTHEIPSILNALNKLL